MSTPIRIKRSAVPGKVPTTSDLQLGELAINTYDGRAFLKKDNGSESIVSVGGGYPGSTYFVAETGLDTNDGEDESTAFATIAKALTVATAGDTIEIASGTFTEVFPLTVPQGVTVRGKGLRSTTIQPTSGTERNDAFLLNGECGVQELSITNFYYDSSADTGYGFKFAPNMVTTTRSPYLQRVTVITRGSDTSASDPYGFDTADNYPTSKVAGRGALIDGSVVSSATLEPAILFNECTFITPNQTGLKMTNGARAEWVNCFTYFASISIDGSSGEVGVGSTANVTLKLDGVSTSITPNQVIKYYQGGPAVAIGTVTSVDGAYVTINGKGSGVFNSVGIGSTQDVRIFQSDGVTQVGTASTILWADYQKFGADLRAIGAASNFGTLGVRGDGAGVQLRLFGYNFGCVGSGKTFTQDPTLTIRSNEAIQLNGGRVFFQSVDQEGNFRVGSIFEISQETGAVSLASTSDINIAGTATITNLNVSGFSTFQGQILHQNSNFITDETTYNLINTNAGAVNFAGAGTSIVIGATTGITTIRNYEVNLSGGQESYSPSTGTLTVDGGVGISSNLNVGKDFKVTGVSTFVDSVRFDTDLRVAGVSTFVDDVMLSSDLDVAGITTTSTLRVTGISTLSGDVRLDNNLRVAGVSTFVGDTSLESNLAVAGVSTMTGSLMVADDLRVAGVSTLVDDVMLGSDLDVAGITTTSTLRVTGISTLTGDVRFDNNIRVAGISTLESTVDINGDLDVDGRTELDTTNISETLNVAGISTFGSDVDINANLDVSGTLTLGSYVQLNSDINITGVVTATAFHTGAEGSAIRVTSDTISGPATINIDPAGVGDNTGTVVIKGDLQIDGTTTTVNSTTVTVDDKNIVLGSGAANDAAADGGGITLESGEGDKTFNWVDSTDSWTSSENIDLATGKAYKISGTEVLRSDQLTVANVNSSGIGTIETLDTTAGTIDYLTSTNVNNLGIATFAGNIDANGDLDVDGRTELDTTNISETLNVVGVSTFVSHVEVDGDFNVAGVSTLTNSVRIEDELNVAGVSTFNSDTTFDSNVAVTGVSTFTADVMLSNNLRVAGISTLESTVDINGDLDVDGRTELDITNISETLNVVGVSTFASDVDINANIDIDGHTQLDSATVAETLDVVGLSTFASNVDINADLDVDGRTELDTTNISETLNVVGVSTFASDVDINANVDIDGHTQLDSTTVAETLDVVGLSTFSSDVDINANIDVDGHSQLDSVTVAETLDVAGLSTFSSDIDINASIDVDGHTELDNLNVSGVSTFVGVSTFQNDLYVGGNLGVTGTSEFIGVVTFRGGTINIGDADTDDVVVGGEFASNLVPTTDGLYDLGTSGKQWRDLYVNGTIDTDQLNVSGVSTFTGTIDANGDLDVDGRTELDTTNISETLRVAGISTLVGDVRLDNNLRVAGVSTLVGDVELDNNLQVTGVTTFVGVSTYQNDLYIGNDLYVGGDARVVGVLTVGSSSITLDGTENQINVGSGATVHTDRVTVTQFRASGVSTFGSSVDIESDFTVTGVSTFTGTVNYDAAIGTSFTNTGTATLNNVNVSGVLTAPFINSDSGADFAQLRVTGISTLADFTFSSGIITGPSQIILDPAGIDDNTGSVRIRGDLYVDGTQTTINSTVVEVGDKLVGLGTTAIEIVQEVTGVNYTNGGVTVTGVNTTGLFVGYGASSNNVISAASSIVSIGASFVVLSVAPTDNSEVILGIGITAILVGSGNTSLTGIDTSNPNIIVGAALSSVNTIDSQEGTFVGINTSVITGISTATILLDDRISGDYIPSNTATGFGVTVVAIGNSSITIDQPSQTPVTAQEVGTLIGVTTNILGVNTISLTTGLTVFGPYIAGGTTVVSIASSQGVGATYPNGFITLSTPSSSPAGVSTDTYFFSAVGVATTSIVVTRSSLSYETVITEIGVGTIYFSPASVEKVGVATVVETVTVRNNGTILFVSDLTGDVLSDGGGLLLYGKTNKTLTWSDATDSWTSSEHFDVVSGKDYKHSGTTFYDGNRLTVPNATIIAGVATDFTIVSGNIQNTIATRITTNDINVATAVTARDVLPEHIQVSAATTTYRLTVTTDTIGQNIDISGIVTANSGFVTTLEGTDITYSGIASFNQLSATTLNIGSIDELNVLGPSTVTSLYATDIEVTSGIASFATQYVNVGYTTELTVTNLSFQNPPAGFATALSVDGTHLGISTTIIGINTVGVEVGDTLNGDYIGAGTTVLSVGVGYSYIDPVFGLVNYPDGIISISTNTTSPNTASATFIGLNTTFIGIDTTSVSIGGTYVGIGTYVFGSFVSVASSIVSIGGTTGDYPLGYVELSTATSSPAGVTTESVYFESTNTGVTTANVGFARTVQNVGFATIVHLDSTYVDVGIGTFTQVDVTTLTVNTGVATIFGVGDLTFNSGIGTVLTTLSGITTSLEVLGVGTHNTANINVGVVTHLEATDLNVTGIATIGEIKQIYTTGIGSVGISTISHLLNENFESTGIGSFEVTRTNVALTTSLTVSGVSTFNAVIGTDAQFTGITTATDITGTYLHYTGIGTINTFISTDVYVGGATSINTFSAYSGIVTSLDWGDGYSSGITSLGTLNVNSGVITSLNAESLDIGFIIGTNFYISGIGSANEFNINVGTSTHFTTNDFEATGFSTVVSFKATDAEVTGVTTLSTLLISPNNELAHISAGTNLDFQGIGTVINLYTNVGVITHLSGTDVEYTGISTLTSIQSVDLRTTGVATITQIEGTSANITGVSTFGDVFATTIKTDALDLTGAAINFTGIATFRILNTDDATIGSARAANLDVTGISTLPRIYNVDIQSTGFSTSYEGLHVGAGGTIITADATSGIGSVGINTSVPRNAFHVYGNIQQDGSTLVGTISTERSTGTAVKVHTELGRFDYRSVEYTVQVSYGVTHQVAKIMSIHDGVTAYNSEYANISTGIDIATFDVQIDNTVPPGNIALVVTPIYGASGITTIVANFQATRLTSL